MTDTFRVTLECSELRLIKLIRSGLIENANIESVVKDQQPSVPTAFFEVPIKHHRISRWDIYRNTRDYLSNDVFTVDAIKVLFDKQNIKSDLSNISAFLCHLTAMDLMEVVGKKGRKNLYRLTRKIDRNKFIELQQKHSAEQNRRQSNGR